MRSNQFQASVGNGGVVLTFAVLLAVGCSTGTDTGKADRLSGEPCAFSDQCASGLCIGVCFAKDWTQVETSVGMSGPGPGALFGSSLDVSDKTLVVAAAGKGSTYRFSYGPDPADREKNRWGHRNTTTWPMAEELNVSAEGSDYVAGMIKRSDFAQGYAHRIGPITNTPLVPALAEDGDGVGASVSMSGGTIVLGATGEASCVAHGAVADPNDNNCLAAGAAYVFEQEGNNWVEKAFLKANHALPNDTFGWSVSVNGSLIAIGAPGESGCDGFSDNSSDADCEGSGAVYIFAKVDGVWKHENYINGNHPRMGHRFGSSVDLVGNFLAVGEPGNAGCESGIAPPHNLTNDCENAGAVWVYERSDDGLWSLSEAIKSENAQAGQEFGRHVSLGPGVLAVGSSGVANAGAVHTYSFDGTQWLQQRTILAVDLGAEADPSFGRMFDLDEDALVISIAGAAAGTGAVYINTVYE